MPTLTHVPVVSRPSEEIAALIRESEELEREMEQWQEVDDAPREDLDDVRRRFRDWMSRAKQQVREEDRDDFHKCYDGGFWSLNDVKTFLATST